MTPHATLPTCPYCSAKEKAVLDLDHGKLHCFACGKNATIDMTFTSGTTVTTLNKSYWTLGASEVSPNAPRDEE